MPLPLRTDQSSIYSTPTTMFADTLPRTSFPQAGRDPFTSSNFAWLPSPPVTPTMLTSSLASRSMYSPVPVVVRPNALSFFEEVMLTCLNAAKKFFLICFFSSCRTRY